MILDRLHKKSKVVEHLSKQNEIINKIYDMCRQFSKQLELATFLTVLILSSSVDCANTSFNLSVERKVTNSKSPTNTRMKEL